MNWAKLLKWVFKLSGYVFGFVCASYLVAILFGVILVFHLPDGHWDLVTRMIVCGVVVLVNLIACVMCDVLSDYFGRRV